MNRAELEEVFNRVYVGQYKKNEKKKVFDGSKTLDRNYFSRIRRVRLRNYYNNIVNFYLIVPILFTVLFAESESTKLYSH